MECHYCGCRVFPAGTSNAKNKPEVTHTKDHIVPKSMGGGWDRENLVTACSQCNNIRGDTPYEVYCAFSKMFRSINGDKRRKAYRKFVHDMAIFGVTTAIDGRLLDDYNFGE